MRVFRGDWRYGLLLALPLLWLAGGCGDGAKPPSDAADTTTPTVEPGEPADADSESPDASGEPVAATEGWGTVKGRIVYVGDPPTQPQIDVPANVDFCKDHEIVDQSLIVNPETKGIKNVFVYLRRKPARVTPDAEVSESPAIIDQKQCTFIPHAQIIRVDQGLKVLSDDPIKHNTHTKPTPKNPEFNELVNANDREGKEIPINRPENQPFQVICDIHSWMSAWVLPLDHPYGAVTDENGNFEIPNLPAGEVSLIVWHERKPNDPIERDLKVTIAADETNDLGEIEVPADKF